MKPAVDPFDPNWRPGPDPRIADPYAQETPRQMMERLGISVQESVRILRGRSLREELARVEDLEGLRRLVGEIIKDKYPVDPDDAPRP